MYIRFVYIGIEELHKNNIIHRDIKYNNVCIELLSNDESPIQGLVRGTAPTPHITIIDLDSCRFQNFVPTIYTPEQRTTIMYRAPEILLGASNYSYPADMWSVGCLIFEMLSPYERVPLFMTTSNTEFDLVFKWAKYLGPITEWNWPGSSQLPFFKHFILTGNYNIAQDMFAHLFDISMLARDLVRKLVVYDPAKRLTATEALQHPFLQGGGT